ncbi:MAG: LysR family transcriptional regulator [Clostridia bacterium]|nr:LysR family transcriptional regulator [Clostridia bacterium]
MNLTQLKYFNAICTYHTVSEAAKNLNISQPSLSNAVKELEKEFGTGLFVRRHHGMVLTREGETLLKLSGDLLGRAGQIEEIMKDMGSMRKTLRLGLPPMIGSLILPRLYKDFAARHPEIKLDIVEGGYKELLQKKEYFDMAFLPHGRQLPPELSCVEAEQLEIVFLSSRSGGIARHTNVNPDTIKNEPLVLFEDSFFQTEEIKRWFALSGVEPNIILQTGQLSAMISMISNNIASGFGFKAMADGNNELVYRHLDNPMYVTVSLAWKKDGYFSSSMKKFKEYVVSERIFENQT